MYWWVATPPKHHLLWIAQIYDKFNDIETESCRGRSVFPESRNLLSVIVEHPTNVWARALIKGLWWARGDSNPYAGAAASKTAVSANSTTRPWSWKLPHRRFTNPNRLWSFKPLTQPSDDQRYAPLRCFLIVTHAFSRLREQEAVNNPKIKSLVIPAGFEPATPAWKAGDLGRLSMGPNQWRLSPSLRRLIPIRFFKQNLMKNYVSTRT